MSMLLPEMTNRGIRIVHTSDPAKVIFGAGDEYRFLATGDDTDGQYFLVEATVPPGGGPPLHVQTREEEGFYILSGKLTFYGEDGEGIVAGPGTYLNVPKGAKHRFRNEEDDTVKMLFFFTPAGIEGLFDEFAEAAEPGADLESAIAAMSVLGRKYGARYFVE